MKTILWRTIWNKKYTLLAYLLGELSMVWLYVALYPTIGKMSESYDQIMQSMPPQLLQAFGFEGSFTGFESYLAAEHYGIIWPIVLIPLLASLTGAVVTKEIEDGTIEMILSMPISRLRIFIAKYLAGVVSLVLFIVFSILSTIPLAYIYNLTFTVKHFFSLSLLGLIFGMAIFSLGMLFSTIFSDRSKVYTLLGGTLVAMYFIKIVAILNDNLTNLKYLSFFHYFDVIDAITKNIIHPETYGVFIGVTILATIGAAIRFVKRDVAV